MRMGLFVNNPIGINLSDHIKPCCKFLSYLAHTKVIFAPQGFLGPFQGLGMTMR
jgi:hypothetical protein